MKLCKLIRVKRASGLIFMHIQRLYHVQQLLFNIVLRAFDEADACYEKGTCVNGLPRSSVSDVGQFCSGDSLGGRTFCREPGKKKFVGFVWPFSSDEPAN